MSPPLTLPSVPSSPSRGRDIVRRCSAYPTRSLTPSSYKFRQASDFWYLTGFDEPDAAVIIGPPLRLLFRSYLLNLRSIRKDQLPKRVQNDSLLVRLKPREGKVGRCKVGIPPHTHNLPTSITHTQDTVHGRQGTLYFRRIPSLSHPTENTTFAPLLIRQHLRRHSQSLLSKVLSEVNPEILVPFLRTEVRMRYHRSPQ